VWNKWNLLVRSSLLQLYILWGQVTICLLPYWNLLSSSSENSISQIKFSEFHYELWKRYNRYMFMHREKLTWGAYEPPEIIIIYNNFCWLSFWCLIFNFIVSILTLSIWSSSFELALFKYGVVELGTVL
jgi:hypothetical protein